MINSLILDGQSKRRQRTAFLATVCIAVSLSIGHVSGDDPPKPEAAKPNGVVYVCPPCGCAGDSKTFDAPGECPNCHMGLVRKGPVHDARKVAMVLFEGVNLLDVAGPSEVFSTAKGSNSHTFEVFTVAATRESVEARNAVATLTPEYSIENCPRPDIVVIPGGSVQALMSDPRMMDWIKARAADSEIIMSVNDGTDALAKAGVLAGHEATSHRWAIRQWRQQYPGIHAVEGRRYVDDGKFVTTASASAGIDAALHVVERFHGPEAAQNTAKAMDYLSPPERQENKP